MKKKPYIMDEEDALKILLEDSIRLDWIINNNVYLSYSIDGDNCYAQYRFDPDDDSAENVPVEGYPIKMYTNPREAIEAAMKYQLAT